MMTMNIMHTLQNTVAWLVLACGISIVLFCAVGFVGIALAALNDDSEQEDL